VLPGGTAVTKCRVYSGSVEQPSEIEAGRITKYQAVTGDLCGSTQFPGGRYPPGTGAARVRPSRRTAMRDENSARTAVKDVLDERADGIDVLVNNAGVALIGSSEETSIEEVNCFLKRISLEFYG
jgi:NAD(P)-dependent dehydrogenase (short-subunit alcohol dehydrogenase family)